MSRAQQAVDNLSHEGDQYLEAVVKEAMRLRPVIFQSTRTLTEDTTLAGYRLPAGVVVSPALGLVGLSEALHDDAAEFRPDRFLAENPAPNTWIPFGGGPRRCIVSPSSSRTATATGSPPPARCSANGCRSPRSTGATGSWCSPRRSTSHDRGWPSEPSIDDGMAVPAHGASISTARHPGQQGPIGQRAGWRSL